MYCTLSRYWIRIKPCANFICRIEYSAGTTTAPYDCFDVQINRMSTWGVRGNYTFAQMESVLLQVGRSSSHGYFYPGLDVELSLLILRKIDRRCVEKWWEGFSETEMLERKLGVCWKVVWSCQTRFEYQARYFVGAQQELTWMYLYLYIYGNMYVP